MLFGGRFVLLIGNCYMLLCTSVFSCCCGQAVVLWPSLVPVPVSAELAVV